jgi:toxin ParE1/3/4
MKTARLTPQARSNVKECSAWIRKDHPAAALRFSHAVERAVHEIEQMPGIGSPRYASLIPGLRMLTVRGFESYLIFYLERETSVDIVRVIHGARDIPEALINEQ